MASFHFGRIFCRVNKTIVKMKQFRLHTYSLEVVCYVIANVCQNPYINCSLTTEWLETFFRLLPIGCVALNCRASVHCICKFACLFMNKSSIRTNWCHLSLWLVNSHRAKYLAMQQFGTLQHPKQCKMHFESSALKHDWHKCSWDGTSKKFNSFPFKLNKLYSFSALISFYSIHAEKKRIT